MKIEVKKYDEDSFGVSFTGFMFTCSRSELTELNEKISKILDETTEEKTEVIWNPRSKRHERITVKK